MNTGRQSGYRGDSQGRHTTDLVEHLNAAFTHIWLYYTPFTYVADKNVQGLSTAQGPGTIPFGNFMPKTWWNQIWLSK